MRGYIGDADAKRALNEVLVLTFRNFRGQMGIIAQEEAEKEGRKCKKPRGKMSSEKRKLEEVAWGENFSTKGGLLLSCGAAKGCRDKGMAELQTALTKFGLGHYTSLSGLGSSLVFMALDTDERVLKRPKKRARAADGDVNVVAVEGAEGVEAVVTDEGARKVEEGLETVVKQLIASMGSARMVFKHILNIVPLQATCVATVEAGHTVCV
jgi:hypothetical protein